MSSTAVVWFRRDLRVHDHPALTEACREHDRVVPLFVFDPKLLAGRFRSAARTDWMLGCLEALDGELRERGGHLVLRHGTPQTEVRAVAREAKASAVYLSEDVTGFARARDERVEEALGRDGVELRRRPGLWVHDDLASLRTGQGKPYTVFSPFRRAWERMERRPIAQRPKEVRVPTTVTKGRLPSLEALGFDEAAPDLVERPEPGEAAGAKAASAWIRGAALTDYDDARNTMAVVTSRMASYLRYGCVSPLGLERRTAGVQGAGAATYRDELAWRDFYAAVQLHFPWTAKLEFVERYRALEWPGGEDEASAWREARTGYPVVDAAMRQLRAMGWMHNRARMIVGSFLTKDLGVDWRVGEEHFMHHLLDGDVPANNGGWQWIASTGTDPAPYFQRMFNPALQQKKFDPDGAYVRRWCPELEKVPDKKLAEPWTMTEDEQREAGCVVGEDWPEPIVDHAQARREALERYRAAG